MSYIRSLSNPECLYIFGSRDAIEIHVGDASKYEDRHYTMPHEAWDGLCRKYVIDFEDEVEFGGAKIRSDVKVSDGYRTVLSYGDWSIAMWLVTWEYVVSGYRLDARASNGQVEDAFAEHSRPKTGSKEDARGSE